MMLNNKEVWNKVKKKKELIFIIGIGDKARQMLYIFFINNEFIQKFVQFMKNTGNKVHNFTRRFSDYFDKPFIGEE